MIKKTNRKKVIHCNLSDIYMSVAFNKGIVVVLHAPKSCSHIVYNALLESRRRIRLRYKKKLPPNYDNLFITGITDREAIFGGEKLLQNSLAEIIKAKKPECLVVLSGCAAGVIGDDIQAICAKTEANFKIPVIHIPGAGFMSNQQQEGLLLTTKYFLEKFMTSSAIKNSKSAVIFGINKFYLMTEDIEEIRRMYNYFGIDDIMLPPCGMTIKEIQELSSASVVGVNSIIDSKLNEYKYFAAGFAQKLQIPFIEKRLPLTITETLAYLQELGAKLNQKELADQAILCETKRWQSKITELRSYLNGKSCVLAISHSIKFWNLLEFIALLQEAGIQLKHVILLNELTAKEKSEYVDFISKNNLQLKIDHENYPLPIDAEKDIIITSDYRETFKHQYCIKRKRIGIGGSIRFLEKLYLLFKENRSLIHE